MIGDATVGAVAERGEDRGVHAPSGVVRFEQRVHAFLGEWREVLADAAAMHERQMRPVEHVFPGARPMRPPDRLDAGQPPPRVEPRFVCRRRVECFGARGGVRCQICPARRCALSATGVHTFAKSRNMWAQTAAVGAVPRR